MPDLSGRVAVVTGTAQGIGRGIAEALERHHAVVHGCDRDTVDVTDAEQVRAFIDSVGRVDILVNNAGGVVEQVGRALEEVSEEDWRAIVDANLTSTFLCTRVNSVAPGFVLSNPMSVAQFERYGEEGRRKLVESIATRRLGTPEDIANGVLFFAAEESSWVTGQVLSIDGGQSIF